MSGYINPDLLALRYERKFRVDQITRAEIENIIKLHPAGFIETFPLRYVNNVYFDSNNLQTYVDNMDGISNRTKVRIRWYGELFGMIAKPTLEYKIKRNQAGAKSQHSLEAFMFEPGVTIQNIRAAVADADIPEDKKHKFMQLRPVLLNRYTRKYYSSADGQYRLTLDYDLYYYRIQETNNTFLHHSVDRRASIIELKYPFVLDKDAHKICSQFPFRMTKNSKYVTGIQGIYK